MENSFLNKFFNPLKLNFLSLILFEFIYKALGTFLLFPYLLHVIRNLITGFGTSLITTDNIRLIFNSSTNILICILILIVVLYYFLLELTVIITGLIYGAEDKAVNLWVLFKDGFLTSLKYLSIENWLAFILIIPFIPLLHIGLQSGISELLYLRLYILYYSDFIISNSTLVITVVIDIFLIIFFSLIFIFFVKLKENILISFYLDWTTFKNHFFKTFIQIIKVLLVCLVIFLIVFLFFLAIGILVYLCGFLLKNNISTQAYRELINIITPLIVTYLTLVVIFLPLCFFSGVIGTCFETKTVLIKEKKSVQALKAFTVGAIIIVFSVYQGINISNSISDDSLLIAQTGALITGHRGNSNVAYESTVKAFNSAIENGAEYIECDLQVTSDGALVVSHSPYILSDQGKLNIKNKTLAELKAQNLRSLDNKESLNEPILTLDELIDLSKGRAKMNIELKKVPNDSGLIQRVIETVKSKGVENDCFIASSYYPYVLEIEESYPELNTLFLTSSNYGDIENLTFDSLSLEQQAIDPDTVRRLHLRGKTIHGWILETEDEILNMLNDDVDYLIVNDVRVAQTVLANHRPSRLEQLQKLLQLIIYRV